MHIWHYVAITCIEGDQLKPNNARWLDVDSLLSHLGRRKWTSTGKLRLFSQVSLGIFSFGSRTPESPALRRSPKVRFCSVLCVVCVFVNDNASRHGMARRHSMIVSCQVHGRVRVARGHRVLVAVVPPDKAVFLALVWSSFLSFPLLVMSPCRFSLCPSLCCSSASQPPSPLLRAPRPAFRCTPSSAHQSPAPSPASSITQPPPSRPPY
jgi:hypothetical protein